MYDGVGCGWWVIIGCFDLIIDLLKSIEWRVSFCA
jgi:hypothetical protein